jgi:hypothetical protein
MRRLTVQVVLTMTLALTSCARAAPSPKVDRGVCANERATMQLDSATTRAPELSPQVGALVVRVRSMQSEPIAGARISFRLARGSVVQGVTSDDGVITLRVAPEAGTLFFGVIGFTVGRLGFTPRAGFADTVRVIARCAVVVY